jgi:pyruvate,water dikinase
MALLYIKRFNEIGIGDLPKVGGKNASLGEMFNTLASKGIAIPDGFAITSDAFWQFIDHNNLRDPLRQLMALLDNIHYTNLSIIGEQARERIAKAEMPELVVNDILNAYADLCQHKLFEVAVRSSATAEDLPTASFAGQHESFLNILGADNIIHAVQKCYVSLYTNRAIKYREDNGFSHEKVALSVGVQKMIRSDKACSGVGFTLEPESGFRNIIHLSGTWGLGENIVQGTIIPDEYLVFKPTLKQNKNAIIQKKLGEKEKTMVYASNGNSSVTTYNIDTPEEKRQQFVLNNEEIIKLANWALIIEEHYKKPMDIEWAKDGITNELFIVQARPETVQSRKNPLAVNEFTILEKKTPIITGEAIGTKIVSGVARILHSTQEINKLHAGEIVVTELTSPDWDPVLKKSGGIITDKGGRTSHASIVARELGVPAVVGTENATKEITDGQLITISCAEGKEGRIYDGQVKWKEANIDFSRTKLPDSTKVMMIVGDPDKAFKLSFYPNNGVGLMRIEFIINHSVQIHPMALVKFNELKDESVKQKIEKITHHYQNKQQYFVEKLAEGVATIAAAFYPKEVIVRMSDFKTNEYANLIGGKDFEPHEENPMLGFRGASRYYHPLYTQGFRLECEAMKRVRNEMGLTNVKLMIPFCRTVEEGKKVIDVMQKYGLKQGENSLEIYVMAEIPSNVLQAEDFAKIFDGFSIGSNDLTQLTLGIDRDSAIISGLFSEENPSAKIMIATVIQKARKLNKPVGLCGQAPSDLPDFAKFLVEQGINSISFNPDALLRGIENINKAEQKPAKVNA